MTRNVKRIERLKDEARSWERRFKIGCGCGLGLFSVPFLLIGALFLARSCHVEEYRVSDVASVRFKGVKKLLPAEAGDISYVWYDIGYKCVRFSIDEKGFLSWVEKRGWKVAEIGGSLKLAGLPADGEIEWRGVVKGYHGENGDLVRDCFIEVVTYDAETGTGYYQMIVD